MSASSEKAPETSEQRFMFRASFMGVYKIHDAIPPDQPAAQVCLCGAKHPVLLYAMTDSGEPLAWTFWEN